MMRIKSASDESEVILIFGQLHIFSKQRQNIIRETLSAGACQASDKSDSE